MSQFSHEHPEDWEEQLEAMIDAADTERKRRREVGLCLECNGLYEHTPTCSIGHMIARTKGEKP